MNCGDNILELNETHIDIINNAIEENSKKIPGTECTEWVGSITGAETPQIWLGEEGVL